MFQSYDATRFYMANGSISAYHDHGPWQVCLPDTSHEQLARVMVKYLREHPEQLHWRSGQVAMLALFQAFPCKNPQPLSTEVRP